MTLPAGTISMSQVAAELGISAAGLSLDHGWVRALAQVGGFGTPFSISSLQGKTGRFDGNLSCGNVNLAVTFGSAPFFGSQLVELDVFLGGSPLVNLYLGAAPSPNWGGPILVRNNTTGIQARLTYFQTTGLAQWQVTGNYANLVRLNTTDSFTVTVTS